MDSSPNSTRTEFVSRPRRSTLATTALVFSILAFIPPFGLAAIVLGHVARRQRTGQSGPNGSTALSALIIAYAQLALVAVGILILWPALDLSIRDLRSDSMVQRVLKTHDMNQVPDYVTAREEESTAKSLMLQMAGIESEHQRTHGPGYLCTISDLLSIGGIEGTTPAESRAFAERIHQSRYSFEIQTCSSGDESAVKPQYKLTAVPRWPQTPTGNGNWCADEKGEATISCSPVYCADQSGVVRQFWGLSSDCFKQGTPVK